MILWIKHPSLVQSALRCDCIYIKYIRSNLTLRPQIPLLLERIRQLLRIYYDAKVGGLKTSDFKFCDIQDISSVGLNLQRAGLMLLVNPARLRVVVRSSPGFEAFVLEDDIDIGKWWLRAHNAKERVHNDREADHADYERIYEMQTAASNDSAGVQMMPFVTNVLIALITISPVIDIEERQRANRAMAKLVGYSTSPLWRTATGDALSDSLRPIYESKELTARFVSAGGLASLIGDWVSFIDRFFLS